MALPTALREKIIQNAPIVIFSDSEYMHEHILIGRPELAHWKEVTQLAAVKWDIKNGKPLEQFCHFVKPKRAAEVPETFWQKHNEITGIEKENILSAKPFPEVYANFLDFCGNYPIVVFALDWHVHQRNMADYSVTLDTSSYKILKPVLVASNEKFNNICSGELYIEIGLSQQDVLPAGSTHNALFDSMSMAKFVGKMVQP